ncbi:hypothetical protein [Enemella evansiae]|uniref:Uncharacterized protein n=1 Tax=Enemella evansiae TaxID=2016499 RepID=A0A255G9N8_9ACTN|nr:hypothetical protein [Enemella evansiae]OYN96740.1 hypothetical protein CGZ95_15725 [Enemella evansiae]OYO03904.1 hypothetical protein CGZ97_10940 [Enemella evansiae]OYO08204.1 hypothetical protein CGZ98_16800 [Enemella evansiae]OYO12628.1 hypothetical protein CGZ94_11975 [Enemella evansiae]TDO86254.1 hypothetical protein C8D81_3629 [Enemella evansiae]
MARATSTGRTGRAGRTVGCFAVVILIVIAVGVLGLAFLRDRQQLPPTQFEQRCVATADGRSVTLTREQAYLTAIIVGVSVQRQLDPQAATIAMATAYQESGIRNLTYGDRDSIGLFQQRPSQDWGTQQQIMDPWYASNAFYNALVKIPNWQNGDVNDTAQAVQKSGFPDAYRKHEQNAVVLSKVFTGQAPGGLSCFDERSNAGQPDAFGTQLALTHGKLSTRTSGKTLTITARNPQQAWSIAHYATANAGLQGIARVETNARTWEPDGNSMPKWISAGSSGERTVIVTFR